MQYEPRTLEQTREGLSECHSAFDKGEHYRFAVRELDSNALTGETMLLGRGNPNTIEENGDVVTMMTFECKQPAC